MEICEYHNSACCGSVWVPEGVKLGGWALLESRLCRFVLGSFGSQPRKGVVGLKNPSAIKGLKFGKN